MSGKSIVSLLLLNLIWGSFYVANKFSLSTLSPLFVGTSVRFLAMLFLTVYIILKGDFRNLFNVKPVIHKLIIIGMLGFSLDITAFLGLQLSTASNASILLKADVLFTNLISVFVLKQKFTKKDWLLTGIILFGTFLVMDVDLTRFQLNGVGDFLFIASAFCVALNGFVIKSVQQDTRVNIRDTTVAFYNNGITFGIFFILFLIYDKQVPFEQIESNNLVIYSLFYTGLMQTAIYILYYYNLRMLQVWIVRIMLLLMPIVASFTSFFVLGETLDLFQIVGMITVILGTMGIILEHKGENKGE
ncbi:MAG TPA: DMT family transporter [Thermotogota bacterium]|nr:DMT family transporter [Thermotogota bacterium]